MKIYTGYHGTDIKSAENILKENKFRVTKNGWLGTGIYFYENNYIMAKKWVGKKNIVDIAIIECLIEVEAEKVLDVTSPDSESTKLFQEERERLIKEIEKRKCLVEAKTKVNLDSKIFKTPVGPGLKK